MKMKTKLKINHICILIAFIMIVFIWAIFMFWWIFPYKTVTINHQPYIVENKVIKQGDNLTYMVDACVYTNVVPTVVKQFVDGIVYAVPENTIKLPMGCNKTLVSVKVPKTLPPSEYHLHIFIDYKVNPIRNIISNYETEKFTVVK